MTNGHSTGSGLAAAAWAAAAVAAALAATSLAAPAGAQGYRHHGHAPGYVVAESRYGKGVVSGEVRPGRHGLQVRLPGGTWIDCVRSCSETLRRQSVDFWESNGPQSKDDGPGYFRWQYRY